VLRLDSLTWRILLGPLPLPFEPIHGLNINREGATVTLAASTESSVYVSLDFGDNWLQYKMGCRVVRIVPISASALWKAASFCF
jgi:hypothetical protein